MLCGLCCGSPQVSAVFGAQYPHGISTCHRAAHPGWKSLTCLALAQGCFWGVEHYINKKFKNGIQKSAVGYTGGDAQNPKCAPEAHG